MADEAVTFKTIDGRQFTNVTVSSKDSEGISVTTDSGVERVSFSNLIPEVQRKFGFDAAKALAEKAAKQKRLEQVSYVGPIVPPEQHGIRVEYHSVASLEKRLRQRLSNKRTPADVIESEVAEIPKGGELWIRIYRSTIEAADLKWFSFFVDDENENEVLRKYGKSQIPEPTDTGPSWRNFIVLPLPKFAGRLRLKVADDLSNASSDFSLVLDPDAEVQNPMVSNSLPLKK